MESKKIMRPYFYQGYLFVATLWGSYYPHFTDKENCGSDKFSNFGVTLLVSMRLSFFFFNEVILITSLYMDFFVFAILVVYKLGILGRRKWV